jgi:copper transport protein
MRGGVRSTVLAATCALGLGPGAAPALAHARLLGSIPASGASLSRAPARVMFGFAEPVTPAALRVYGPDGRLVEAGRVFRPSGDARRIAIAVRRGSPRGAYEAVFRVISDDGHVEVGGIAFNVGGARRSAGVLLSRLEARASAGPITKLAAGVARASGYAALALVLGVIGFVVLVWRPALRDADQAAGAHGADAAVGGRARGLVLAAAIAGAIAAIIELALQGALAGGSSLWSALSAPVLGDTVATHAGAVMLAAVIAWAWLCATVVRDRRSATGIPAVALACAGAVLAVAPVLAGHAWSHGPRALMVPVGAIHMCAMAVWLGGLVALVALVPGVTATLPPRTRRGVRTAVAGRFSGLAGLAVAALLATGAIQALAYIPSAGALFDSTYGIRVAVKIALACALLGLGWLNRSRLVPALRSVVPAASVERMLGRTVRTEIAVISVVLVVTAGLATDPPPVATTRPPAARAESRPGSARPPTAARPASPRSRASVLRRPALPRRRGGPGARSRAAA